MSDSAASSRRDSGHDVGAPLLPPDLDAIERLVAAIEDPDEGADEAQGTGHQAQERGPSEGAQPADQRAPSASWGADPDDEPLPRIDGYRVIERLGAGGGGEVFRAVRDGAERHVAIKLVRARPGRTPGAGRAWRELDVFADLRLDCMPRVLDFGAAHGRLYIATELIAGKPLDEAAGELDRRGRVGLLADVADAVQQLHERGVIHRDIKPSNVLVDEAGKPFIIDLGVASLMTSDVMETLTAEGAPIGTPAFMAPEQARGDRDKVSIRSDVYALGATALFVIAGQGPHDVSGSLHEAVHRVAHDPPREPRAIDPTLPKRLAAVLAKATESDPDRRYASAREFADDLRRWLKGDSVEATPPGPLRKLGRQVGRHPVWATSLVSLAIAGLIIATTFVLLLWLNGVPTSARLDADEQCVYVFNRLGAVVSSFDSRTRDGITDYEFIPAGVSSSSGAMLVIAYAKGADSEHRGRVVVHDPTNPRLVLWHSPPLVVPPQLMNACGPMSDEDLSTFHPRDIVVADVIAESSGNEIVATLHHLYSPSVILVWTLDGRELMRFWHDGHISSMVWLPASHTLLAAGCNSERSWAELGVPESGIGDYKYPDVVFALEPRVLAKAVIARMVETATERPSVVKWYRFLAPVEIVSHFRFVDSAVRESFAPYDRESTARITMAWERQKGAILQWHVTDSGELIGGSLIAPPGVEELQTELIRLQDHPVIDD
jgi:serine/threonine protein kinase